MDFGNASGTLPIGVNVTQSVSQLHMNEECYTNLAFTIFVCIGKKLKKDNAKKLVKFPTKKEHFLYLLKCPYGKLNPNYLVVYIIFVTLGCP